jgi:hypothetical protein
MVFDSEKSQIFQNLFLLHIIFLKRFFCNKKFDMELEKTFGLFLEGCFSSSFKGKLIFFSNFKKILR